MILFDDYSSPSVLVFCNTILDVAQMVEEFLRPRTWFVAEGINLACVEVINMADGTDNCCCSTSTCLFECLQLLFGNLTALNLHA